MGTIASGQGEGILQARIVVARGKHVFEWEVPVIGLDLSAEVELPIGTWELTILLLDAEGTVQFQSTPHTVEVLPNGTQLVEVALRPGDGVRQSHNRLGRFSSGRTPAVPGCTSMMNARS